MSDVCNVCGTAGVKKILALPDYPLNSIYISEYSDDKKFVSDFELYQCAKCFHIQGVSKMPLDAIYNEAYGYNSATAGVQGRLHLMVGRVLEHTKGKKFNRVIEAGCNDLSLLKRLKQEGIAANHWIGIDPVPLKKADQQEDILFIQGYVQEVEIPYGNNDLPDLIISDQVFEHIPRINQVLMELSKIISPNSSFIVCVPSLELLIGNYSFQYIIHEHLNYFSVGALTNLFSSCNFKLEHSELINELTDGYLLQVYSKPANYINTTAVKTIDLLPKFENNFKIYQQGLALVKDIIRHHVEGKIYGFGASHITGNFAYYLKSDLAELTYFLDDTPYRQNMFIPRLKPQIQKTSEVSDISDATILITAPQASRPVITRLLSLKPKRIISPLNVF